MRGREEGERRERGRMIPPGTFGIDAPGGYSLTAKRNGTQRDLGVDEWNSHPVVVQQLVAHVTKIVQCLQNVTNAQKLVPCTLQNSILRQRHSLLSP